MEHFKHNGLSLEYEVTGNGQPLVFLHGMGGSVKQIYSTYEPLEGIQLITLNQQGHGNSEADWTYYDFDHLGDDVIALLDHLQIKKACFAGISMGAAVGLNIACRYPERAEKLLLIRNAWTDQPMSQKVQQAYADLGHCLKKGGLETFYSTESWKIVKEPSAYTRNAFLAPFSDESCLRFWQKYIILPAKTPIRSREVLARLDMPVTILANKNDLCHPFEYGVYLQKQIPGAVLIEIPDKDTDGTKHKKMINKMIQEFIPT